MFAILPALRRSQPTGRAVALGRAGALGRAAAPVGYTAREAPAQAPQLPRYSRRIQADRCVSAGGV